jgi:hypothetical protein
VLAGRASGTVLAGRASGTTLARRDAIGTSPQAAKPPSTVIAVPVM